MRSVDAQVSYVTPHGGESGRPMHIHPAEMVITEHPSGVIEVADPLFDERYRIGDRSLISDPVVDDVVRAVWDYFGVHMSTRQLCRTERFDIIPSLGRWNRMQHSIGAVAMTARFGGTPNQLAEMAVHDIGHRVGSHRFESLIGNKLKDNDHEHDMVGLFWRTGFTAELIRRGLCDEQGMLANGLTLNDLHHSEGKPTGITNWPASTGFPETERLNYVLTEKALWQTSPEEARRVLETVVRDRSSPYGDQLVFTDVGAAASYAEAQVRCRTEHWQEPFFEIESELTVTLTRYALGSLAPEMEPYNHYHPGDSLRALEEDWQQALLAMSESDAGVAGMIAIIDLIAAWRRAIPANPKAPGYKEYGPMTPGWMTLFAAQQGRLARPIRASYQPGGQYAAVSIAAGKRRPVNPVVGVPGGRQQLLTDIYPDLPAAHARQGHWSSIAFDAVLDLGSKSLGLTPAERRGVLRVISPGVYATWENEVLRRPLMGEAELTNRITAAGKRYRQIGAMMLACPA